VVVDVEKKQKFLYLIVLAGLSLFITSGCGKKFSSGEAPGSPSDTPPVSVAGKTVTFDASVPEDQAQMIREDLDRFQRLSFSSQEDAELFGLSTLNNQTMSAWLSERVKVIVGESYDYASLAKGESYDYSPRVFARSSPQEAEFSKMTTIMSNTGAYVYLKGKEADALFTLPINGVSIPIRTPRVGIIRIGPGLFTVNRIKSSDLNSLANVLVRMGTLFHEARHSDGNGKTAGFPHASCTINNQVSSACEMNLNGPYMLEAKFLKLAQSICKSNSCTVEELEGLKYFQADSASRLIGANMPDPRPEGI
jgi:hypothetical protein